MSGDGRAGDVAAFGVVAPGARVERMVIPRRDLGPHDIDVEVAFVGICHSDVHNARDEWGHTTFPLVPGHEISGTVRAVGTSVSSHAVGDRVGVGVMVDSCRTCAQCRAGNEQYCEAGCVETYNDVDKDGQPTMGGYSERIVVDEHFVYRIPDALSLEAAAPLMCAGITVYSPLRHWGATRGTRVAVVGLGGLGHMAVKLASAMGATVTVVSRSAAKAADSVRLGAARHVAVNETPLSAFREQFDMVVNTVSAPIDLDAHLALVATDGVLVNVGLPPERLNLAASSLIDHRRSLAGSMIGGVAETQRMLEFCAEKGCAADVEVVSASEIAMAWDRVVAGDVRYRLVIDCSTIR